MQLLDAISRHAREHPRSIAVRQLDAPQGEHAIDYASLALRINAAAADLRNLLPRGAVLLQCMGNRPEFWIAFYAALAADLSIFTVSADLAQAELDRAATAAGAAAILLETGSALHAPPAYAQPHPLPAVAGDVRLLRHPAAAATQPGPGLLLASSGSTGMPKIVWRSGESLDAVSAAMHEAIGFHPRQTILTGVPMCHSYGCEHGVLGPAFGGATVLCCSGIKLPLIAAALRTGEVNIIPGVPFLFDILAQAEDLADHQHALRSVYSAGAPLPLPIHDAFHARFGVRVGQVYGATEVGSVTFNDPAGRDFDPVSAGQPLSGVELRILLTIDPDLRHPLPATTEGQLAVHAASMMSHVVCGEAEWAKGSDNRRGFLLSGDLARLDSAHRLTLTGRLRLLIDIAGRKVNPVEVESVLKEHPGISECVIVAVPVSQTVNRLKAVVTLKHPAAGIDTEELRQFARRRLSSYKVPRVVEIRTSLPRSPLGKILRHRIEENA